MTLSRNLMLVISMSLFLALGACKKPEMAIQGKSIELENFDTTVSPATDFFQYVNGGWIAKNPIPETESSWGSFNELRVFNTMAVRNILDSASKATNAPKGSAMQMIGDFYASGMDSAKIEADGIKPLAGDLAKIDAIKSPSDIPAVVAYLHAHAAPMFALFGSQDDKNSTMVIAQAYQGGLGLPDREYYFKADSKDYREAYMKYISRVFSLLGEKNGDAHAKTIMDIETQLAKASMSLEDQRDPNKVYHKMTIAELNTICPNFDWNKYLTAAGIGDIKDLNVSQPEFFKALSGMMKSVKLDDWKSYLKFHLVDHATPYLSHDFVDAGFEFHGKAMTGARAQRPRWRRVSTETDGDLGDLLGQVYVAKHFPPAAKDRAIKMINNMKDAFRARIQRLEWMSDSTRQKALAKLNSFTVKVGYPDKWRDMSGIEVTRDSYLANVFNAENWERRYRMDEIGKPVDRTRWGMTPPTVNAYYNPSMNEIVFPAGILQYPFFNPNADDAFNYGAIAVVIGHEMTHGFDDQGSQYDAEGNLKNWWSESDLKKFKELSQNVRKQYDEYVALDTLHVNGQLTLGENMADLGGLNIAYEALQNTLKGKNAPKINGFTPEQRFFMAYAQMWRVNYRAKALEQQVRTNPHSPGRFRANGPISNMPEFAKAFGLPQENWPMQRKDQIKIW